MNELTLLDQLRAEFPQLTFVVTSDHHTSSLTVTGKDGDLFEFMSHLIHWSKEQKE